MVDSRGETEVKEQKAKVVVAAHGISSLPHRPQAGIAAHGIVMTGSREIGARAVGGVATGRSDMFAPGSRQLKHCHIAIRAITLQLCGVFTLFILRLQISGTQPHA